VSAVINALLDLYVHALAVTMRKRDKMFSPGEIT